MAKIKAKKANIQEKKVKNKIKDKKVQSETEIVVKKFIVLVVVMIVAVVAVYFLSKMLVDKRNTLPADESVAGVIDYDIASVGTLFNRPYDEYYVMIYDSEEAEAVYYSSLITKYQSKKDALKIYFCDLGNSLNSEYKSTDETTKVNTTDLSELKFGKVTLLKIKNGKVNKAYEDLENIKKALQ